MDSWKSEQIHAVVVEPEDEELVSQCDVASSPQEVIAPRGDDEDVAHHQNVSTSRRRQGSCVGIEEQFAFDSHAMGVAARGSCQGPAAVELQRGGAQLFAAAMRSAGRETRRVAPRQAEQVMRSAVRGGSDVPVRCSIESPTAQHGKSELPAGYRRSQRIRGRRERHGSEPHSGRNKDGKVTNSIPTRTLSIGATRTVEAGRPRW
eukprot:TRINITY_DN68777_c0_g1_i1.p1 TRINITY_DN68777_c0_g1~~TRINITY_DN68777_c0_g1_i1.p1  ORF type:complete len:205 (+),score=28.11 TRINITY_DN68777_c0_g1_i1:95-709(+)